MKWPLLIFPLFCGFAWGQTLDFDLATVEQKSLAHSPLLKAHRETANASKFRSAAQRSRLWPSLGIEASYRHQSEVPSFKASPVSPLIEMGDNENYSLGPAVSWLAWDSKAVKWTVAAMDHQAIAQTQEVLATEVQLRLAVRVAFFQIQGQVEGLRFVGEGLRLAQAQRSDITIRHQAGSASRQDLLLAEAEVMARRQDFRKAQTTLSGGVRNLMALMGEDQEIDLSRPLSADLSLNRPAGVPDPTVVLTVPAPSALRDQFETAMDRSFNEKHPGIRSLVYQTQAAQSSAQAVKAGNGPIVQLTAKSSFDYPNGPVHERIHQNAIGAMAHWPLFEGGRVLRETREREAMARSLEERRRQTEENLQRDWRMLREEISGLKEEFVLANQSLLYYQQLAQLAYASFQAGQKPFLDVQAANLALLNAQVKSAKTEVEILSRLAVLSSLTSEVAPCK
ncbi:MAG: TolC family protein [Elusimicrobia bacterium]|jgi:outer membrane protein TolC|nr:TolC family protein [Elusimicrobiota bacterium]